MLLFSGLTQHVYAQKASDVFCETSTVDRFGPEGAAHAKQFLARLQAAIRRDDRHQVAAMVEYPLRGDSAGISNKSFGQRRSLRPPMT